MELAETEPTPETVVAPHVEVPVVPVGRVEMPERAVPEAPAPAGLAATAATQGVFSETAETAGTDHGPVPDMPLTRAVTVGPEGSWRPEALRAVGTQVRTAPGTAMEATAVPEDFLQQVLR